MKNFITHNAECGACDNDFEKFEKDAKSCDFHGDHPFKFCVFLNSKKCECIAAAVQYKETHPFMATRKPD